MTGKTDTYGLENSGTFSLADLQLLFAEKGVTKAFWKALSPNDNSKNQPYLGSDFSTLQVIPSAELEVVSSQSNKPKTRAGRDLIKAALDLEWLDCFGELYPAPNAKLILYPQYPEVRFSGFLQGSRVSMSEWMDPKKKGRIEGRYLVLGITTSGNVLGYLAVPGSKLAEEIAQLEVVSVTSVFNQFPLQASAASSKRLLLEALAEINGLGWNPSVRLYRNDNGVIETREYQAINGGGYTLEALLGIFPNGDTAPDFHGWEVKQFRVESCEKAEQVAKPVTLMTPEPDGGDYKSNGVNEFVRVYGYPDRQGRPNRMNFGGTHYVGKENQSTSLRLELVGLSESGKSFDVSGAIQLLSKNADVAASWSFVKLLEHWRKKHSNAVYVPCVPTPEKRRQYHYCTPVFLGTGTDFALYLRAMRNGFVYYDPGIKLEHKNGKETTKRRSQFRARFKDVARLYNHWEKAELNR